MRKLASILATAGVLVSLSACATAPSVAGCDSSGNAALVTAEGAFGADPAAEFPTPLVATTVETSEIRPGDGGEVPRGGLVYGTVSVYDGETGDVLGGASPLAAVPILAGTVDSAYPFAEALSCAEVGARLTTVGTNEQLFGEAGIGGGFELDHTLVVVTDVSDAFLGKAEGSIQVAQSGMPAIVLAPNGQPGFTFPDSAQPDETRTDLLIRGSGNVVEDGDNVVLNYTTIAWDGAAVSASSWSEGVASPAILALDGADSPPFTVEVKDAIVGQTVGSQLLISVPGESGLVYVIDVLGIAE